MISRDAKTDLTSPIHFIVYGDTRTGSTYLRNMLNDHPNITCLWELLHHYPKKNNFADFEMMLNQVFQTRSRRRNIQAEGFLLHYPDVHKRPQLTKQYFEHYSPAIIHTIRRNVLNKLLSQKLAFKYQRWANFVYPKEPIFITTRKLHETIKKQDDDLAEVQQRFGKHVLCEVYYEDIQQNREAELAKVFRSLRVCNADVTPKTIKQRVYTQKELIANYDQLKADFANTQYEWFFEC